MNKYLNNFKNIIIGLSKVAITIIITIIAVALWLWISLCYEHHKKEKNIIYKEPFHTGDWHNPHNNRVEMYNDLEKTFLSKYPTIDEVVDTLGKTSVRRVYDTKNGKLICLEYTMGTVGGFLYTNFYLIICPDETGKFVKSYKLIDDRYKEGTEIFEYKK
jgi:hypothetical protein